MNRPYVCVAVFAFFVSVLLPLPRLKSDTLAFLANNQLNPGLFTTYVGWVEETVAPYGGLRLLVGSFFTRRVK